jgi:glycerate kinase
MSDVNNPLCGERGATAIFGPQKGVRPEEDRGYRRTLAVYAALAENALGRDAADRPGPARPAAWASRCSSWAGRFAPAPRSSRT